MKKIILIALFLISSCAVNEVQNNSSSYTQNQKRQKRKSRYQSSSFFKKRFDTTYLKEKSDNFITDLIGEPDIKRFDHPTQTWLYQRENGTLFLFFEQQHDKNIVKYIEARNRIDDNKVDSDEFLRRSF